jgi:hypothetical protein
MTSLSDTDSIIYKSLYTLSYVLYSASFTVDLFGTLLKLPCKDTETDTSFLKWRLQKNWLKTRIIRNGFGIPKSRLMHNDCFRRHRK